jgi:RNA polymerase sigma-70 factor (ECF subfamily)
VNRAPTPLATDPFAELVDRHADGVYRYLRSVVGDDEAARDLLQDTFLKLRRHAGQAGVGLVFTAARSCAVDHLRSRRRRDQVEAPLAATTLDATAGSEATRPDRVAERAELRADLIAALGALPEEQRTVFHLSEIEGLRYEEIAGILDVSPGTIASRKHHAVRKLREQLRRRGHDA